MQTRRVFLSLCAGVSAAILAIPARAQDAPRKLTVYDDELRDGWQNWSWGSKVALSVAVGGAKPIKVEGEAWSALSLHRNEAVSTAGLTKLTFYINGGVEGGQTLTVRATADGKALTSDYVIAPKAKTWSVVEVPLKDINALGKNIDGLQWQAPGNPIKPYFITRIQLE